MRPQRFFLTPESINKENASVRITDLQTLSQIKTVLRLRQGDPIVVLDGSGCLYECVLANTNAREIEANIVNSSPAGGDPPVSVRAALPMLRGGRFEWALQKLTELGVAAVTPIVSSRSVVKQARRTAGEKQADNEEMSGKLPRWQSIVREAAEQCERATVPVVTQPVSFLDLVRQLESERKSGAAGMICAERSAAPLLREYLHSLTADQISRQYISVIVGPEGGFAEEEIEHAVACGIAPVSLGPRILRSETAAIFALAQIISTVGDA